MNKKRRGASIALILLLLCLCSLVTLYYWGRPLPVEQRQELYEGVVYYRKVHYSPRLLIAHIVTVRLDAPGVSFLVTPPDDQFADLPLRARTTSQFLDEYGLQVAINGDGFSPWFSNSLWDYYPHPGDGVVPNGFAMSQGVQYAEGHEPSVYLSGDNRVSFFDWLSGASMAISGDRILVLNGEPVADLDDTIPAPRTALGMDHGSKLILIVVDGRQPLYSEGATLYELAELLILYGAETAINLDGGGSSTLVINGNVINSPIDLNIPGRERAVGNHFGVYVRP